LLRKEARKRFFLKKEAEIFFHQARAVRRRVRVRRKVFWFFFSKKNRLPCLKLLCQD
jgi:hypothetical protein